MPTDLTKDEKRHLDMIENQIDCLIALGWRRMRIEAYVTLMLIGERAN